MMAGPEDGYWNLGGPKTYSEADIDAAIAAGALSAETAARLKEHALRSAGSSAVSAMADEEHFRLIGGFNDIFVVVACMLLLFALGRLFHPLHPSLGAVAVAVAAWGLAEYFVREKRLALTAIALLSAFAAGVFLSVWWFWDASGLILPGAVTALAALLHWRRFHVPVSVACGVGAVLVFLLSVFFGTFPAAKDFMAPVLFGSGLVTLVLAMRWDSSDILRQTRRSDVAFWLHLLAAPLLVHPLFSRLGVFSGATTPGLAWIMVALYGIIGLLSLIIDRRALMVSSLAYVIYAFMVVFKEYGVVYEDLAVAALVIGTALLLLAALWQSARAAALALLPRNLQRRLPPGSTYAVRSKA